MAPARRVRGLASERHARRRLGGPDARPRSPSPSKWRRRGSAASRLRSAWWRWWRARSALPSSAPIAGFRWAPTSTITPIFAGALAALAASGAGADPGAAALLALLVGVALVAAGIFRLGFIADLLSIPVTTGFLAGVAVHILVSQAPVLMGVALAAGRDDRQDRRAVRRGGRRQSRDAADRLWRVRGDARRRADLGAHSRRLARRHRRRRCSRPRSGWRPKASRRSACCPRKA